MNEMHTTEVTAERRSRRLEESVKRKAYRVAHGLEPADGQGIELPASTRAAIGIGPAADKATTEASSDFVDFEGKKRPIKKWLGIW